MKQENEHYAITKTLRFKLEAQNQALATEIKALENSFDDEKSSQLLQNLKLFSESLAKYLFKEENKVNFNLKIKDKFLRSYTKAEYIEARLKKNNFYSISQIKFVINILTATLSRFQQLLQSYQDLQERPLQNQAKRAEFALLFKQLSNKNNFIFLKELVYYSQDKENDKLKSQLSNLIERIEPLLLVAKNYYLPAQSSGVVIAKASLNYYTINKKPKDYDKEILAKKEFLNNLYENDKTKFLENTIEYKKDKGNVYETFIYPLLPEKITIADAYSQIKKFKAEEKAKFYEAATQGKLVFNNLKNEHPLFDCNEKSFVDFISKTKEITKLNGDINGLDIYKHSQQIKKHKNEIKNLKIQRGKDFIMQPKNGGARKYIGLSNLYKAVAMKYGKLKAKIKALEQEKLQSQLLNYWLLIHQIDLTKHQLILIPRENRQIAKQLLEESTRLENTTNDNCIVWFKSLTLRALRKLCFSGEQNRFKGKLKRELIKYSHIDGEYSLENFKNEKDLIEFYQTVINSDYFNKVIDIHDFNNFSQLQQQQFTSLADFEIQLEKSCYTTIKIAASKVLQQLQEQCQIQILDITSYDLQKDARRKSADKAHTQIWKQFWQKENAQKHYPLRLNPEIAISYRLAKETRLKKYGVESDNYNPQRFKQNRYCQAQLSLISTITENALANKLDFAYLDNDKLTTKIEEYNINFNSTLPEDKGNIYYYGIDRGNDELATLATIAKFSKNSAEFLNFEVFKLKDITHSKEITLKDGTKKIRKAIDNISYFIDEEELFDKTESATVDLTTAKLIKGKIVANGDVKTYLKLKSLSARRRLYQYHSTANIANADKPIWFDEADQVFCIKTNDNNDKAIIYYFRQELSEHSSKDDIKNELESYLQDLKKYNQERDLLTAEKINHLRDAMSANMIGILFHLYKKHSGILVLEDLNQDILNSHFMASNESIGRRLEWAIYKKLQQFDVTPPNLKDTIVLRKSNEVKQFGAVLYVSEANTSKTCPNCLKVATTVYDNGKPIDKNRSPYKSKSNEEKTRIKDTENKYKNTFKENKFKNRKFVCPHCGFDTCNPPDKFKNINDPDILASYNIAKRGYEFLQNPPKKNKLNKYHNQSVGKKNNYKAKKNSNKPDKFRNNPFSDLDKMIKKKE